MKELKDYAVILENISKVYKVYDKTSHRVLYSLTRTNAFKPRDFKALENISIKIKKGEILGIIGKNGAGKSTVLKIITGVSYPTSGKSYISGRISSLLELGAGFNMELTGIENIYLQGNIMGINKDEMSKRIEKIIKFADIGDFINQPVKTYSSGMFARLAFATAINVDPEILIVDEVLAVGDIAFQFKCIETMKEFAKKGITIIFVTHSMMSLYRFCTRCIWIDNGNVKMDGLVEEVVPRYEDFIRSRTSKNDLDTKLKEGESLKEVENEYLKMHKFRLLQDGEPTKKIKLNQSFSLEVNYELYKDLKENPFCAISIIKDGLTYDIFGVYPSQKRYELSNKKGKYTIIFEFINPNFNVSDYEVYFSILEKNGISQLFFGHAINFKVIGEINTLGLVDVDHKVSLKKGW